MAGIDVELKVKTLGARVSSPSKLVRSAHVLSVHHTINFSTRPHREHACRKFAQTNTQIFINACRETDRLTARQTPTHTTKRAAHTGMHEHGPYPKSAPLAVVAIGHVSQRVAHGEALTHGRISDNVAAMYAFRIKNQKA